MTGFGHLEPVVTVGQTDQGYQNNNLQFSRDLSWKGYLVWVVHKRMVVIWKVGSLRRGYGQVEKSSNQEGISSEVPKLPRRATQWGGRTRGWDRSQCRERDLKEIVSIAECYGEVKWRKNRVRERFLLWKTLKTSLTRPWKQVDSRETSLKNKRWSPRRLGENTAIQRTTH